MWNTLTAPLQRAVFRTLTIFLSFLVFPAGAEEKTAMTAEVLHQIVEQATTEGETPEALSFYPTMKQAIKAELHIREDELDFTERLTLIRKVSAPDYLVFQFRSDNIRGAYATDIIAAGESPGSFRRWRLLPDGRIARFTGAMNLDPDRTRRDQSSSFTKGTSTLLWKGFIEKDGHPTGDELLASELISNIDLKDLSVRSLHWNNIILSKGRIVRRECARFHETSSPAGTTGPQPDSKAEGPKGLLARLLGKKKTPEEEPEMPPEVYEFKKLNFGFTHPRGSYSKMDVKLVNPEASLALVQNRPNRMFLIVAEDVGADTGLAVDGLVEIVRANLTSLYPSVRIGPSEDLTIGGIRYKTFASNAAMPTGRTARWCHRVAMKQGFAYQLILFSIEPGTSPLSKELAEIAGGFRILDPKRLGMGLHVAQAPVYDSPEFGLRVDPSSFQGVLWEQTNLTTQFPAATYGALTRSGGGLVVIPLDLNGLDPDTETLATTLRTCAGLGEETDGLEEEDCSQGSATGTKSTARYEFQGTLYTHQVRVLKNGKRAFALSAYTPGKNPEKIKEVEAMLDGIQISRPSPFQDTTRVSASEAETLNMMGLHHHGQGDPRGAIPFYEEADKRNPQNTTFFINLMQAHMDAGLSEQGLTLLEARLKTLGTPPPTLIAFHGKLLADAGQNRESADIYRKLFAGKWRDDNHLQTYLGVLIKLGELENAAGAIDTYVALHQVKSLRVVRWQQQVHAQAGHFATALEIARDLVKRHSSNPTVKLDLAIALIDAEEEDEALALLDGGDFGSTEATEILFQRGRALNGKRRFHKAKECFEKALAGAPNEPLILEALAFASAMLGQGDQASIRDRIDPVPVPPALSKAITHAVRTSKPEHGFSYRIETSRTGVHYQPDKPLKRTEYREVTIHTRPGVEQFKNVSFTFNPTYERAFVNELTVLDESGAVVATGKVGDYYVSGGTGGPDALATGERTVTAPVPGLRPGHRLRYTYTIESKANFDTPPFERYLFGGMVPVGPRAVFLTGAVDSLRGVTDNGDFLEGVGEGFRYWLVPAPPRFELEALLPELDRFLPGLTLGSPAATWEDIGREYLKQIAGPLEASAEIRKLADNLTLAHKDDAGRLKAILSFVQTELTYQGIEFGRRARIPHSADQCLKNRYGDCKDHSLLAHLLLRSVGIDSQLVLVHTGSSLQDTLPSLDQFNHMIIRVGDRETGLFYDCTSEHLDPTLGVSASLQGSQAFVLHPSDPALEIIPVADPRRNRVTTERDLRFSREKNEFSVKETIEFHGEQAQWLRNYLSSTSPAEYANTLVRILGADHRLQIDKVDLDGLQQPSQPLRVSMLYRITHALHAGEQTLSGPLPSIWESFYFSSGAATKRRAPFKLLNAYVFETTCRLHLDDPTTSGSIWKSGGKAAPWAAWDTTVSNSSGIHTLHARMEIKRGTFPSESFRKYHQSLADFLDTLHGRLSVKSDDSNS